MFTLGGMREVFETIMLAHEPYFTYYFSTTPNTYSATKKLK